MLSRLENAAKRRFRFAGRLKFVLESILTLVSIVALGLAIWHHLTANQSEPAPGEGKRVVAFRQVANRVCTENKLNMEVAQKEARSKVERLGYIARALGWDLNDLESITAPPVKFDGFLDEVAVRQELRGELLALQRAIKLGDGDGRVLAIGSINELNIESREISRETGIDRCINAVPSTRELLEPLKAKRR